MRCLKLVLLIIASAFLVVMLYGIGWSNLAYYLRKVGYWWPLVLVPYGLFNLLGALSWKVLLSARKGYPTLTRLFLLRLAGESINQLTPTASLGGEPFKALRLHLDGVAWEEAAGCLVVHKGVTVLSLALYVMMSVLLAPFVFTGRLPHPVFLNAGVVMFGLAGVIFVVLQFSNPLVSTIRLLSKMRLCPAVLSSKKESLGALDFYLAEFYRKHLGRCAAAFLLLAAGWGVHAAEVYIIFGLLDQPVGWGTAFCFDGLAMLFSSLGFMIPGSLGVQDGGNVLLSLGLGLVPAFGAAFSVIRRLREVFWLALGLLIIAREK